MTDYILASTRPILGNDRKGKCDMCGKEAWYSYKSQILAMGEKNPLKVFCTACLFPPSGQQES